VFFFVLQEKKKATLSSPSFLFSCTALRISLQRYSAMKKAMAAMPSPSLCLLRCAGALLQSNEKGDDSCRRLFFFFLLCFAALHCSEEGDGIAVIAFFFLLCSYSVTPRRRRWQPSAVAFFYLL